MQKNCRLSKRNCDMGLNHASLNDGFHVPHTSPTPERRVSGITTRGCFIPRWGVGLVCGLVALLMTSASADDSAVQETKPAAKAVAAKPVDAQQVLEVFEAFGNLFDDVAAVAAGAPILADPLEQQFAPQIQLVVNSELHFVRKVCQPTPKQYESLKLVGDRAAKNTLRKIAQAQKKMQQGVQPGQQVEWPDPRSLISELLAKEIAATLSAEQAERYQLELVKRAEARKRVTLLNLVAKIDKDLLLTAEQRTKLSESLTTNWKSTWGQQLEVFVYGDQFTPILPEERVLPFLNEKQKTIWKSAPKNENQFWGWMGFGFMQGVATEEDGVLIEEKVEEKADDKRDAEPQELKKEES